MDYQRRRREDRICEHNRAVPNIIPLNVKDDAGPPIGAHVSDDESSIDSLLEHPTTESEGDFDSPNDIPQPSPSSPTLPWNASPEGDTSPEGAKSKRTRKQWPEAVWERGSDGKMKRVELSKLNRDLYHLTFGPQTVPPMAQKLSKKKKRLNYKQYKRILREHGDMGLHRMSLVEQCPTVAELMASPLAKYITLAADDCGYGGTAEELIVDYIHPLFLKAKAAASREDNPNWREATNGPFADDYWKAMQVEIATLESMGAWEIVDRADDMNVIDSTWAFKCKRYPDGLIKKFKARFCARGDQQLEGIDFFETYAPVVQWTTVRLMLILEVLLGLKSKQGDVTAAFLHADIPEGKNVFVDMPRGFEQYTKSGRKKCLKLKKTLYGLRQSPRAFWKYLTEKLELTGLKQSEFDPCLFVGEEVICIVYVDDLIFWSKQDDDIHDVAMNLRELGVDLEQENDAAGFLGVTLERDEKTGLLEMKQTGLIQRVIEAVGLDDGMAKGKFTPSELSPLVKDADGEPAGGMFSYSSVVGMLLYLSGHTRPDIAYAVNCCARYMFCPRRSHELALKRLARYLKHTQDRGLILNPDSAMCKVDAYPDADFAGTYGHEKPTDPACAKSRSGFIIMFSDCPVLWVSKLQTETALSTMEAEINALAHCCRELFPILDMTASLGKAVGLPIGVPAMKVSVHEDNAGALILAKTLPPQFTPRSKYYATKTIWFREEVNKRGIFLLKIETLEQLGDIFTKGLPRQTFEYLRKKIMGW